MVRALVLDLLPLQDGPSEGRLIRSAMENIGWEVRLVEKPSREQALDALFHGWRADVIHISAHGQSGRIFAGRGSIAPRDFRDSFRRLLKDEDTWLDDTTLLVNSTCRASSQKWHEFVLGELGVHNYIAPVGSPTLAEGIVFPIGFYLELWGRRLTRRNILRAYGRAFVKYFNETPWQIFPPVPSPTSSFRKLNRSLVDFG